MARRCVVAQGPKSSEGTALALHQHGATYVRGMAQVRDAHTHMHLSVGMMGRRYVFYDIESWSRGLNSPSSEYTISGQEIFYKSMLTRRARVGIAGTAETSIRTISSWIPLQALLPYDSKLLSVSTIKVSDNIPFLKGPTKPLS